MKILRKLSLLALIICLPIMATSCNKIVLNPGPFDEYTAQLFKTLVASELNSNYLFLDPTSFGLDAHYAPSLPTPSGSSALSKLIINLYFGSMKYYNYDELDFDEQMTYNIIVDLLDDINSRTDEMDYMSDDYLGSYLGYQAQLPILLAEYHFRDQTDIDNYFIFMDLVPNTFKTYVDYEVEKANAGYGMPNFVIDRVIEQCENFVSDVDNHFLITTFADRINDLDFITEEQKAAYILTNTEKVTGPLVEGYTYVAENLDQVYDLATNNLGLAHYVKEDGTEIGKQVYAIMFKEATGYDLPMDEVIDYLQTNLDERMDKMRALIARVGSTNLNAMIEANPLMDTSQAYEQVMAYLDAIDGYFPSISDILAANQTQITLKNVPEAMENNFSPAAYMVSAIDNYQNEFIYLNNSKIAIQGANYLYTVLAHEGVPGHMYQNIYFKNLEDVNILRKVLKSSGYSEGWATYTELYSYNFLAGTVDQDLLDYLKLSDEINGILTARLDVGIHYEGWDNETTLNYLNNYYNGYTTERVDAIMHQLIEVPTNSQQYFFTYLKLVDMYDEAVSAYGDDFDPVAFHKVILDCGAAPMRFLETVMDEYIAQAEPMADK